MAIHVDLTPVDSIHKNPAKLKKWTIFFGGHPKQQKRTPLDAEGLQEESQMFM
jgi:hypothetical protein